MSRRARTRLPVREAKHALAYAGPEDDDDEPDIRDEDPRCYVCGERQSVTDSGCCGHGGEQSECPRW